MHWLFGCDLHTGQRDLQTLWDKYYTECHAIAFVVDSTDRERMEDVVRVFGMRPAFAAHFRTVHWFTVSFLRLNCLSVVHFRALAVVH